MGKKTKAKKAKPPKRKDQPEDWQEVHSPTVEHTARGDVRHDPVTQRPYREILGIGRRRKGDAELMMGLDPGQTQAAEDLREAYFAVVGGVAVRGASYEARVDNQRSHYTNLAADVDKTTHYFAWVSACRSAGVDIDAVQEVICEGYSLRTVDRARTRRKGWAAEQVRMGLNQWDGARPKKRAATGQASRSIRPAHAAYWVVS